MYKMTKLSPQVAKNVDHWSSDLFDESTRSEVQNLENNPEELEDRFYKNLDFGYTNVHIVEEQATPNGDFPTVKSPNPAHFWTLDYGCRTRKPFCSAQRCQ